jgi:Proto-chlorophyllide reductase 57 kD subunit
MKFLCVPCDSPMKLQSVGPPERGSLSVVYSCPECGYEMAMLTNAYETQVVQSLGVKIGPDNDGKPLSTAGSGCPFTGMIPAKEETRPGQAGAPDARTLRGGVEAGAPDARTLRGGVEAGKPAPVRWTAAAEARLANIPEFVRPMAKTGIERFARERGALEIDEKILDEARDFFGM